MDSMHGVRRSSLFVSVSGDINTCNRSYILDPFVGLLSSMLSICYRLALLQAETDSSIAYITNRRSTSNGWLLLSCGFCE